MQSKILQKAITGAKSQVFSTVSTAEVTQQQMLRTAQSPMLELDLAGRCTRRSCAVQFTNKNVQCVALESFLAINIAHNFPQILLVEEEEQWPDNGHGMPAGDILLGPAAGDIFV